MTFEEVNITFQGKNIMGLDYGLKLQLQLSFLATKTPPKKEHCSTDLVFKTVSTLLQ